APATAAPADARPADPARGEAVRSADRARAPRDASGDALSGVLDAARVPAGVAGDAGAVAAPGRAAARPARAAVMSSHVAAYLEAHGPRFARELAELVAFPSVSSSPAARPALAACARWIARQLGRLGARDARVIATAGHPVVVGR